MTRCAVVGGGMLGMTLALRLARDGWSVTLYEESAELGGLAAPWRIRGTTWDRHYHVMLDTDTALLSLLRDLRLHGEVVWRNARTNFFIDGRMHPFTSTLDHVRFPALRAIDKARLAGMIQRAKRHSDWRDLENVGIEAWLREESGDRVFERIWRPLLLAKFGTAYSTCNAASIWATIRRYVDAQHRGTQRLGYVRGGYATIVDALARALVREGARIRTATAVEHVYSVDRQLSIETAEGTRFYDRVVMALPTPAIARITDALSGEEHDRLSAIEYQGVVCASLILDQPLGDAYRTNIADPEIPFSAAIEMTALVDPAAFGHRSLIYLPRYCTPRESFFVRGDAEMRAQAFAALAKMYPSFNPETVRAFRVSRVPAAFALPVVGYSGRLPGFSTSVPGLYIATSAQITHGTPDVNQTLALADEAATAIAGDVRYARGGIREAAR